MNKKIIIANWKMNPITAAQARQLAVAIAKQAATVRKVTTIICPPFVYLQALLNVRGQLSHVSFGAQDAFWEFEGAYTGEVSPTMLSKMGVKYVVLGHSERRKYLGETDEVVGKKAAAAVAAGLIPIMCVGEQYREGRTWDEITHYVSGQLEGIFSSFAMADKKNRTIIIAYEPVWAISTFGGQADTPDSAAQMISFIRDYLNAKRHTLNAQVIYGGSVNEKNAEGFLSRFEIEGALVGGASLKPKEFAAILTVAEQANK